MSASEKLMALEEHAHLGRGPLWDALPQIVAVVEAAESEHPDPNNYSATEVGANDVTECPTCAALAALDEALS